jgi:putative MATE family efflux protein
MCEALQHPRTEPLESPPPAPAGAGEVAPAPRGRLARVRAGWRLVRSSLSGAEHDYTTLPLGRAIVLLAVPMVLEMAMESLFAICDVFFVSRLGVEAVAAVGLTEAVLTLLYALAAGLATATTATVARRIGEGRPREAATATVQAVLAGLVIAAVVAVPGALFAPRVLALMGGSPALVTAGSGYTRVLLGGSATVVLIFVLNAAFRGAGDAALAVRTLWLANAVNIVLDPCLIFGLGPFPELGLPGAAVATTIGRGVGVVYQLTVLLGARGRLRVGLADLGVQLAVLGRLLRVAVGSTLQFLIATASWMALVRMLGAFGSAAVAGYTIAIRVVIVALLPPYGLSNAAATLVGQNLGAGRSDRAARAVWAASAYAVAFLCAVGVALVVAAPRLVGLFTSDPEVLAFGVDCLRVVSLGFPFYALGMVVVQALNGAGDTATPTAINLGAYWLFQLPLALVLAHAARLGALGVFLAVPIAETVMTVAAVVAFRRGRWRRTRV